MTFYLIEQGRRSGGEHLLRNSAYDWLCKAIINPTKSQKELQRGKYDLLVSGTENSHTVW